MDEYVLTRSVVSNSISIGNSEQVYIFSPSLYVSYLIIVYNNSGGIDFGFI